MLEIQGNIFEIFNVTTLKGNFHKIEFILAIENEQFISFDALGDKLKLLEKFKKGDSVLVMFQLKGKLWMNPKGEKKYYNTLEVIDIQYNVS